MTTRRGGAGKEPVEADVGTAPRGGAGLRVPLAVAVCVLVTVLTARAGAPVGAGVYYDDGTYLALGRALAEGDGYVYSNLPEPVPGVKYPPAYPLLLAGAWKVFGSYPANLAALKALNAVFVGGAAGLTFLLFAGGGRRRVIVMAAVAAFSYLTVPTLSLSTVLLSEPLFMLLTAATLLAAGRVLTNAEGREGEGRSGGEPGKTTHASHGREEWGAAVAAGMLAAGAFLTRSVGLALLAAVLGALLLRRRIRALLVTAAVAAPPALLWLAWSWSRSAEVPASLVGQYGGYLTWLSMDTTGGLDGPLTWLADIATSNSRPLVETLALVWFPRAGSVASGFVLILLGSVAAFGLWRCARRNLALGLFPVLYLAIVFVWPYGPYRFLYVLLPFLTLLLFEGAFELIPRVRSETPRWSMAAAALAAAILALNALEYQVRGYARRAWELAQTIPASGYGPLNEWIRENTEPQAVIASALDPYVHWETGRAAVPSWRFQATDYGRYDRRPEVLAAHLDSILVRFRPTHVALIQGENKASLTLEAFAELHPERAVKVLESSEGGFRGTIYRIAAPGEVLPPQTDADESATGNTR